MPTKTGRREKGTGSIAQRSSDGMWIASITLPSHGSKRRRKVVARKKYEDAVKALREMRRELDKAGDLATSSPTLATWLDTWLTRVAAKRLKPRTLTTYQGYIERVIVPAIGKARLDKLTPTHVHTLHDYAETHGLSSTSTLQVHAILRVALRDAMREGKVTTNVADRDHVAAPRKAVTKRGALTAQQAGTLLSSVASIPDEAVHWSIALLAGLRQGERLGITADALDLGDPEKREGVLTVSWQLQRLRWAHGCGKAKTGGWTCGLTRAGACPQRTMPIPAGQEATEVHGGLWLTRPKSRAGWREVPVTGLLYDVLERHVAATTPAKSGLLLHRNGLPVDPRDDSAAWHAALKRAGLPDVPLHSARHTTATLLHELGIPEHTRVQIMGHSSATTTAGYTHVADPLMRDALGRLGTLLAPQIEGA
ncbi:site-specific integrase [Cellulomonas sp. ACRRI]|uniref:tyrosine-type recombinase/integrase n=1 Tax=Cellulomonas sp. ACRRI TaxID=2918188 RepID=UPI001EF23129|nr:site-specific integrase [Cellulomonas sp. ACRRI]MCG7285340.1 site-specific integrase [Cellulomonas sp. ACRRI]